MVSLNGRESLNGYEATVNVAEVLEEKRFEVRWVAVGETGRWELWVRQLGTGHAWHKLTVVAHKLACNCRAYEFSKERPESCKHVIAGAEWLEVEARKVGHKSGQIAFCLGCHNDPHRLKARNALDRRRIERVEEETGEPITLEQLFQLS